MTDLRRKKTLELGNENIMWFSSISHNAQIINIILKYGYEIIEYVARILAIIECYNNSS